MCSSDENKRELDEFSLLCWYFRVHVRYVMLSWSQAATVKYIFKLTKVYQQKQSHSELFCLQKLYATSDPYLYMNLPFLVFNINHATFGMSSPLQETKKPLSVKATHLFLQCPASLDA